VVVEYALRGSIDAAEYKHVVLGLIFLKYISDAFEEHRKKLLAESYADPEEPDEYRGDNIFWVPLKAPWSELQRNARDPSIGQLVDQAMESVENYELEPQYRSCCHKPFNICYIET
jgi:type I restriction enzyme M protein